MRASYATKSRTFLAGTLLAFALSGCSSVGSASEMQENVKTKTTVELTAKGEGDVRGFVGNEVLTGWVDGYMWRWSMNGESLGKSRNDGTGLDSEVAFKGLASPLTRLDPFTEDIIWSHNEEIQEDNVMCSKPWKSATLIGCESKAWHWETGELAFEIQPDPEYGYGKVVERYNAVDQLVLSWDEKTLGEEDSYNPVTGYKILDLKTGKTSDMQLSTVNDFIYPPDYDSIETVRSTVEDSFFSTSTIGRTSVKEAKPFSPTNDYKWVKESDELMYVAAFSRNMTNVVPVSVAYVEIVENQFLPTRAAIQFLDFNSGDLLGEVPSEDLADLLGIEFNSFGPKNIFMISEREFLVSYELLDEAGDPISDESFGVFRFK